MTQEEKKAVQAVETRLRHMHYAAVQDGESWWAKETKSCADLLYSAVRMSPKKRVKSTPSRDISS